MPQNQNAPAPGIAGAEPSNDDIALLCDIGDSFQAPPDADKQMRLSRLMAEGYVECADPDRAPEKYQLTAKAQQLLAERGAGLNEA
jgi:hypothetical protein